DLDPKTVSVTSDDKAFVPRIENPGERAFRLVVDWTKHGKKPVLETKLHVTAGREAAPGPGKVRTPAAGLPPPPAPRGAWCGPPRRRDWPCSSSRAPRMPRRPRPTSRSRRPTSTPAT